MDGALGAQGKNNGGIYQFSIPRADHIKAGGMAVAPAMGTAIAINFEPTGDGKAAMMPWRDVPEFVRTSLWEGPTNVSRALLEFAILTAARSGEARAMTWAEVDLNRKVWTVPADRMKARVAHRVPLSALVLEILQAQQELHPETDLVFPSPRGLVLTDMVLTKFLRDHQAQSSEPGRTATAHGFRSSFRDWASESGYSRDLAERALAHTVRNEVEAAYHRTDLLEQRRKMMEAWAQHVEGRGEASKVMRLRG